MSKSEIATPLASVTRITSLDQFRGYSVAAMFVVNFVQHMDVAHQTLRHNNTHFSYADSIMPSFILACGFAYRMAFAKLVAKGNLEFALAQLRRRILVRSFGLILLSAMFFSLGGRFFSWSDMSASNVAKFAAELLKANLWEVLAIIGACQIFILPLMATTSKFRLTAVALLSVLHTLLSWSFNYDFVYGRSNWMDAYFGGAGKRAWDGGCFGIIAWSQIMLVGTIAYDITQRSPGGKSVRRLIVLGTLMMIMGYSMSCLTRLYDVRGLTDDQVQSLTQSPVFPNFATVSNRPWSNLFAEAPFVAPPSTKERVANYWQMDKRVVSVSFVFFSSGFALALYGLFVLACDIHNWNIGVFRTFGQNALAAYIIHHLVTRTWFSIVPHDSSLGWVLISLLGSFCTTYLFVRYLEIRSLYLRL